MMPASSKDKMGIDAIAMALPVLLVPLAAGAAPTTYTLVSTGGAGSLGSASFSQANATFTGTADTANLQEFIGAPSIGAHGRPEYTNHSTMALTSFTVVIGGLPAATLLKPLTIRYSYGAGIYVVGSPNLSYIGDSVPTPPSTPGILGSFGPALSFTGDAPFTGTAATTQGQLSLQYPNLTDLTFLAVLGPVVPGTPVPSRARWPFSPPGFLGRSSRSGVGGAWAEPAPLAEPATAVVLGGGLLVLGTYGGGAPGITPGGQTR